MSEVDIKVEPETPLGDECDVLRALHLPFYDPDAGRLTPSAFIGKDISVSCLCYLSVDELIKIFSRDLDNDSRKVTGVAKINSGELRKLEISSSRRVIDVFYSPIEPDHNGDGNVAHSEIRSKDENQLPSDITRGIANRIISICQVSQV